MHMRTLQLATVLLATALAGCHANENAVTVGSYMTLHGSTVAVHAPGRQDALISPAGELSINRQPVVITDSERDLLKQYHANAMAIREHGIAAGKAGLATAGQALSSVASGLASGDTDKIDAEVGASVAKVDASANLICDDLASIRTIQQSLASQLEAFRPYALIKADEAINCRGHTKTRVR